MYKILVPTDFTNLSVFARNLADKIANHLDAELHLLHIVQTSSDVALDKDGMPIESCATDQNSLKIQALEAQKKLEQEWVEHVSAKCETEVVFGNILNTILKKVEDDKIDLVVMGTEAVSGFRETFSGSLAEVLVKNLKVPLLSMKCERSHMDFSDFLITGEFEPKLVEDISVLKSLQKVFNSQLHLLGINTKKNFKNTKDWQDRMSEFARINKLENVKFHIHNDESTEAGIVNFSNNYDNTHELDIDIIAIQKNPKKSFWSLTKNSTSQVINHVYRALITYQ